MKKKITGIMMALVLLASTGCGAQSGAATQTDVGKTEAGTSDTGKTETEKTAQDETSVSEEEMTYPLLVEYAHWADDDEIKGSFMIDACEGDSFTVDQRICDLVATILQVSDDEIVLSYTYSDQAEMEPIELKLAKGEKKDVFVPSLDSGGVTCFTYKGHETDASDDAWENQAEEAAVSRGESWVLRPTVLRDNCGVDAFFTYLPEDWMASVSTEMMISTYYPLRSVVTLMAPDRSCAILMVTPMSYREKYKGSTMSTDYEDSPDDGTTRLLNEYATFLHKRDASEFSDLFLSEMGLFWQSCKEQPVDATEVKRYAEAMKAVGNDAVNTVRYSIGATANSTTVSTTVSLTDYEGSISCKSGVLTDGNGTEYAELTAYNGSVTYLVNQDIPNDLITLKTWEETTDWTNYGVFLYLADDREAYERYYDMAHFIMSNSGTTAMYEQCKNQILTYMIPKVVDGAMQTMNYGYQLMSEVSQSYNGTNDRVSQMWDDYILDQDRYRASDGTELVVPTTADYVYYNGDQVVWSTSPSYDPGRGYEQVN
ncbi:MAG: hypothetical protein Q4B73_09135 [Lachnospiraceae bacterium]|nr:hypothetical protein [Lachnospiraceae bacterium]